MHQLNPSAKVANEKHRIYAEDERPAGMGEKRERSDGSPDGLREHPIRVLLSTSMSTNRLLYMKRACMYICFNLTQPTQFDILRVRSFN